jgi:hypothetical protein
MEEREVFRKVHNGVYVGAGAVVSRNQYGMWIVKRDGKQVGFFSTLAKAKQFTIGK